MDVSWGASVLEPTCWRAAFSVGLGRLVRVLGRLAQAPQACGTHDLWQAPELSLNLADVNEGVPMFWDCRGRVCSTCVP